MASEPTLTTDDGSSEGAWSARPLSRRDLLRMAGAVGLGGLGVGLVGSAANAATKKKTTTTKKRTTTTTKAVTTTAATAATALAAADCVDIPEETAGPYPGDGTNGPSVLTQSGVVRKDIRSSFGSSSTVATGVPLTVVLTLVDTAKCTPLSGAAVYLWHCDATGNYSMYSQGVTGENFLRGVQASDAAGQVTFQSIFPGAYSGRWPHIHFEVFPDVASATNGANKTATSQLALPEATCKLVYATSGYESSVRNLAQTSLTRDNVFGDDGAVHQLATMSGDVAKGFVARLTVGV